MDRCGKESPGQEGQAGSEIVDRHRHDLRQSQETLFRALPAGIGVVVERVFVEVNDFLCKMLRYERDELLGQELRLIYPSDGDYEYASGEGYARPGAEEAGAVETRFRRKDGSVIDVSLRFAPIDPVDWSKGTCFVAWDITGRRKAEAELRQREDLLRRVLDLLPVGLWIADKDGKLLAGNPAGIRIWGAEPLVSLDEYGIFKARRLPGGEPVAPDDWAIYHSVKEGVTIENELLEIDAFDGEKKIILNWSTPVLDDAGQIQAAFAINHDVTEMIKAQNQLQDALREKEILLRELYHRTKNNMYVISSLLSLQARRSDALEVQTILAELENRIRAMALVHEKLYKSQNLSQIDLKDYTLDLAELIFSGYQDVLGAVNLTFDLQTIEVTIEKAIPYGLVLSELLSNAFKHAFPEGLSGTVAVRLKRIGAGEIELQIANDGVSVPNGFDFRGQDSLGLKTIFMLVEYQLQGRVEYTGPPGVTCRVVFPIS